MVNDESQQFVLETSVQLKSIRADNSNNDWREMCRTYQLYWTGKELFSSTD